MFPLAFISCTYILFIPIRRNAIRHQFFRSFHLRYGLCAIPPPRSDKLYASVGYSTGAMRSPAAGWLHSDKVGKVVSISGSARSSPGSVAMRYVQRSGMY
jgi:hypothetical protein